MKLGENWKNSIKITLVVVVLFGGFVVIGTFAEYMNYLSSVGECENYNNEYGYYTEMSDGSFWSGSRPKCLIIMEDGTKLPLEHYQTMSLKNPLIRNG